MLDIILADLEPIPVIPTTAPTLAKCLVSLMTAFDRTDAEFAGAWRAACAALEAVPSVSAAVLTLQDGDYWRAEDGSLVPVRAVKEADKVEDGFVRSIAAAALQLSGSLARFKGMAMSEGQALVDLLGADYGVKVGGTKGNVSFYTYDREWQVELAKADKLSFGAEIQVARAALEQWVQEAQGAPELKLIINRAFGLDAEGQIRANELFRLMAYEMPGETWAAAMKALRDSIRIDGKAEYLRVRRRNSEGRYDLVPLSLASV
ncbi:MAG: DUF3164 family protein [Azospirillaceae bacterium]|nr:DUF3164 family protein [Azospirillaceae bacterium]